MYATKQIRPISNLLSKERVICLLTLFNVYNMFRRWCFPAHHPDRLVSFNIIYGAVHIIHVLVNHLYSDMNLMFYTLTIIDLKK